MTDPPRSHISPRVHSYGNLLKVQPRSAAAHGTSEHEVTQAHLLWLQSLQPANPGHTSQQPTFSSLWGYPAVRMLPPSHNPSLTTAQHQLGATVTPLWPARWLSQLSGCYQICHPILSPRSRRDFLLAKRSWQARQTNSCILLGAKITWKKKKKSKLSGSFLHHPCPHTVRQLLIFILHTKK